MNMIIGQKYKAHKDNVIDIFNLYKKNKGKENDGIDIDFLETRIKSLQDGKYTLAIAGEVKAGKSTFINALLGAEVLPADVLQATSAIVEIFKSENSYLKVKFANDRIEEVYDDLTTELIDEAKERLREICSLKDEYREIPTTIIDKIIIESDEKIEINELLINNLNAKAGTNIDFAKQGEIIKKYVDEHTKENIPVEIEFGYPFKWSFDEFRIVDTPGVNAVGGVQDISYQYLETANAILFVKPINQIELESFKNFVNSKISKRSKDSLFLVLTQIGIHFENYERLYNEAIRLYENIIPKERILAVDSILSLIHTDLKNGKTVKEIRELSTAKKQIIPYFRDKAEDENKTFEEIVLNCSGFSKMYDSIDEFSSIAPSLQLAEILDIIKKGYETQTEQYNEKINRLNQKKQNPQEFEESIKKISEALKKYHNLLLNTKYELENKYELNYSSINEEINKLKIICPEKITYSSDIESARKNLIDAIREIETFIENIANQIKTDFNTKFEQLGKSFKKEYDVTLPKVDFNSIETKAKKNAYKQEDVFEERERKIDGGDIGGGAGGAAAGAGIGALIGSIFPGFGTLIGGAIGGLIGGIGGGVGTRKARGVKEKVKVGTKEVYDSKKHLDAYKSECNREFYTIINNSPNLIKSFLSKFSDAFEIEINSVIDERQKALDEELKKKQSNQEIINEIEKLDLFIKEIIPQINRITELKENLL